MIRNSFCILDGIGEKLERRLWRDGVLDWKDFVASETIRGFSPERKLLYDERLQRFGVELKAGNSVFFGGELQRREHWRLFETFRDSAVCLDIETNGLMPDAGGYITVIGFYDGSDYRRLVRGDNLTPENIARELGRYKLLITFYGAVFDVPFILRSFSGLSLHMPHFDLCFAAKRLGMKGGLKKLETGLGIARDESVRGMDGYDAVILWGSAMRGSSEAMDLLVRYNREDTVNLMRMADILYGRLRQSTGIEEYLACGVA